MLAGIIKIYKRMGILLLVMFITVISLPSFTACSKKNKEVKKNEKFEFIYSAEFMKTKNVTINDTTKTCTTEYGFYLISSHDNDKGYVNNFLGCSFSDGKIIRKKMKDLRKKEAVIGLCADNEENIIIITYDESKGKDNEKTYMLNVDQNGNVFNRIELKPYKGVWFSESQSAVYINDKLLLYNEHEIYIFNRNGMQDKVVEVEDNIDNMFVTENGKAYIVISCPETDYNIIIYEVNMETGELGELFRNEASLLEFIMDVNSFDNNNIYLSGFNGVFEYNLEKNKFQMLFNWLDVGIDGDAVVNFHIMDDGSITVICDEETEDGVSYLEFANITKRKYPENEAKTKLTMAVMDIGRMVKDEIIKFNRTSENYRIEVIEYDLYKPFPESQEPMHLDIMNGKIPDIIEVSHYTKEQYIKENIIVDLYPLMEKDTEIKKEDFIDSVRSTMEYNGKLYYMPISFRLGGLIGSKKDFGNMEGWSYEDMVEKYNNMPKDKIFMSGITREWFIENMLSIQLEDFINYETGEAHFNSKEFINMLKFSKKFKSYDSGYPEKYDVQEPVKNGSPLLKELYMDGFQDILNYESFYREQGGFTVLSPPSKDKNNKIEMYTAAYGGCYSISEECNDKAGAWNFLKRFYTYEFQKELYSGFSVRKDVLSEDAGHALKTSEQKDIFYSIINRIGKYQTYYYGLFDTVLEMIFEETELFYAGERTAKETAEELQRRVQALYY